MASAVRERTGACFCPLPPAPRSEDASVSKCSVSAAVFVPVVARSTTCTYNAQRRVIVAALDVLEARNQEFQSLCKAKVSALGNSTFWVPCTYCKLCARVTTSTRSQHLTPWGRKRLTQK